MGRSPRATPETLALACKKLQAEDNLTIHTLRHELGGGGAECLTRGLRAWRQQQRDEARAPLEQMVSAALKTALTDDLQRVRDEAMQEVHAAYAEDRAQLDFCLAETRQLEQELDKAEAKVAAMDAASARIRAEAEASVREATDLARAQTQRADELACRLGDAQQAHRDKTAEYAKVCQQRDQAAEALAREQGHHLDTRQQRDALAETKIAETVERAKLEERCTQQQEMLRYVRADLDATTRALKEAHAQKAQLRQAAQASEQVAVQAQVRLKALHHKAKSRLFWAPIFRANLAKTQPPKPLEIST